jgi:hypothetical protein
VNSRLRRAITHRTTLVAIAAFLLAVGWIATRQRLPVSYALATSDATSCIGVGQDSLILHGRLDGDLPKTWANDHLTVYWPVGYSAHFDPQLVVVDRSGAVRAQEGDEMLATSPWHGLNVCYQSGGIVDVSEVGPAGT